VLEDGTTGGVGERRENVIGCDLCDLGLHGGNHNHTVMGCQEQFCESCALFCWLRWRMRRRRPFMSVCGSVRFPLKWVIQHVRAWRPEALPAHRLLGHADTQREWRKKTTAVH
jgi:hypothetical protein